MTTILLVEDEAALAELITDELTASGYNIVYASNGKEALKKLQDTEPDCIICDRVMPVMTGFEFIELLRSVYPQYETVPFIFLTALADPRDEQAVKAFKPAAYLGKPVDFDVLHETLKRVLNI
ncbi:MAG: response regulator [Alphaproteobacteria bacterium]|nr:response regulator [Alphaproteobacteria bacterium]